MKIDITCELVNAENKKYVKISFTDNGKGIKQNLSSFLFNQRADRHWLENCFWIIKNHKGKIEVESAEDKYTAFHIYLPILKETDLSLKKKIILIGESKITETVKEILNLFDYYVYLVKNWEEALKIYYQI